MISATIFILIVVGVTSYFCFSNRKLFMQLAHVPYLERTKGQYYRWFTSIFVHANFTHLLVNGFVLWSFGTYVEGVFKYLFGIGEGVPLYLVLIAVTAIASDLPSYFKHQKNPQYVAVGISGVTMAILYVSILFNPWQEVLFFGVIPIPGIIFGLVYLGYETWASKNANDNIGHGAHIWGAISGMIYFSIIYPPALSRFWEELQAGFPL